MAPSVQHPTNFIVPNRFLLSSRQNALQKLLSFYAVDFYDKIQIGDTILYEGGQQTKVILSKG